MISPGTDLAPTSATSDDQLVDLWLHARSPHTKRAYRGDIRRFVAFVATPLRLVTLGHVQAFADSLATLKPTSRARTLAAVKSLLAFGHRLGYLPFDVGRVVRLPPRRDTLAERILSESDVARLIQLEPSPRNALLLVLLYSAGIRAAELSTLCWRDVQDRDGGGQVTVFGKGGKTRAIVLPAVIYGELVAYRDGAAAELPVFSARGAQPMSPRTVGRVVFKAAERAGIEGKVSPHWLRHAHASHALDHGAPIHLVQATLGHASVATTGRYLHARPTDSSARYLPALVLRRAAAARRRR